MSNAAHLRGSAQWIRFPRVVCKTWVHHNGRQPVVLMGDAAHTAHFSDRLGHQAGAGGCDRAGALHRPFPDLGGGGRSARRALADYEAVRSVEVLKIQNAARNSTEWFENVARYVNLPAPQFAYSLLTRSQRISHENLRLRDKRLRGAVRGLDRPDRRAAPRAVAAAGAARCSRRSRCAAPR